MSAKNATEKRVLHLDPRDNVLVALADLPKGAIVTSSGQDYLLLSDIPEKHKFLTQNLSVGEDIIMYGVLVGKATQIAETFRRQIREGPGPDMGARPRRRVRSEGRFGGPGSKTGDAQLTLTL